MSTITAPLHRTPPRSFDSRLALLSTQRRNAVRKVQRWHEGFDSDRNTSLCEQTLRANLGTRSRL